MAGTWMHNVAQAWLVYTLTGSGAALGLEVVETAGTDAGLIAGLLEWAAQTKKRK